MKSLATLVLCIVSLSIQVQAGEPSYEIGGVQISRDMPEESVRSKLTEPYRLWCPEVTPGEEAVSCVISATDGTAARHLRRHQSI